MAQSVENLPAIQETLVRFLGLEHPWRKERLPTSVFWPGGFHGLYSPWDRKELDMTKLTFTFTVNWSGLHLAPALGVGMWWPLIPRGVWGTTWWLG